MIRFQSLLGTDCLHTSKHTNIWHKMSKGPMSHVVDPPTVTGLKSFGNSKRGLAHDRAIVFHHGRRHRHMPSFIVA